MDDLRGGQSWHGEETHGLHKSCRAEQLAGPVVYIRKGEQASRAGGCHGERGPAKLSWAEESGAYVSGAAHYLCTALSRPAAPMSFFGRGSRETNTPPPGAYSRLQPGESPAAAPPPRSPFRPASAQNNPSYGYNDAPNAAFEKRRSPAPPQYHQQRASGQSYVCFCRRERRISCVHSSSAVFEVVAQPSEALALTNCLICCPRDFDHGQHVLVKGAYAATVKSVFSLFTVHPLIHQQA